MSIFPITLSDLYSGEEEDIGDVTNYLIKPFNTDNDLNNNEGYFKNSNGENILIPLSFYKLKNIDTIIILKLVKLFKMGLMNESFQVKINNTPYIMIKNNDNIILSDKIDNYYGEHEEMTKKDIKRKIVLQWILSLDGVYTDNVILRQNITNKVDICFPQLLVLNPVLSTDTSNFSCNEIVEKWFGNDNNEFLLMLYDIINSKPISILREEMKNIIASYDPKKLHWVNLICSRLQNFI